MKFATKLSSAALFIPLLAFAAMAQQPQPPSVQAQADAATVQAQRVLVMLNAQITMDQNIIDGLKAQVADLQAKLKKPDEPKDKPKE